MSRNSEIEASIRLAMAAHGKWKLRIKTAMSLQKSDVTPEDACCDDRCDFGRWLYGPSIDAETRAGAPYQVVRRLHAEFHQAAGEALEAALGGRRRKADREVFKTFDERSEKLNRALSKWLGEVRNG